MRGNSFYNTYRPKRFDQVLGQKQSTEILRKQAQLSAFHHAYLFYGASGTGKTTTARILAMALNCGSMNGTGEPCGECPNCKTTLDGANWDCIEFDGASQRGIDDIRDLRLKAYLMPIGNKKVYIIDEAHALTEPAWNALLKLLEEPPPHLVFILCSTEAAKIPMTVKSRCQCYPFHQIAPQYVKEKLSRIIEEWGIELEDKAIEFIAQQAAGNMRAAETILEQVTVLKV